MKMLSLNTWGGRVGQPLLDFFAAHADIDVFLLQEVFCQATERTLWNERCRPNGFQDVVDRLPDHAGFFSPSVVNEWGLAAFVKKSILVRESGDVFVHKTMDSLNGRDGTAIGRNIQYLKIRSNDGRPCALLNFHGLWTGKDKNDTEERLEQSRRLVAFIKTFTGEIVLGGDFNLNPDTESLRMIPDELGLRNLITEYGVTTTRTSFYTKPEKFADYLFVSPTIEVRDFQVLPDVISDHAPLLLEI